MLGTSILTACIPSLKRVLEAFRSGAGTVGAITTAYELGNSDLGSRPKSSTRAGFTKGLSSNATASGGRNRGGEKLQELGIQGSRSGGGRIGSDDRLSGKGHTTSMLTRGDLGYSKGTVERTESITGLTDNTILQTITYGIEIDEHLPGEATLSSQDGGSGYSYSTRDDNGSRTFVDFDGP